MLINRGGECIFCAAQSLLLYLNVTENHDMPHTFSAKILVLIAIQNCHIPCLIPATIESFEQLQELNNFTRVVQ